MINEEQELLNEAKRRYPIGTTYRCVVDNNLGKNITEPKFCPTREGCICAKFKNSTQWQFIYIDKKWAEIISLPENYVNEVHFCIY